MLKLILSALQFAGVFGLRWTSGGGGSSSSTSKPDPNMQSISAQNYSAAQQSADNPYMPYYGGDSFEYRYLSPEYTSSYYAIKNGQITGAPQVNWFEQTGTINPLAIANARTAGFNADQYNAFNLARQLGGVGGSEMGFGLNMLRNGYTSLRSGAGALGSGSRLINSGGNALRFGSGMIGQGVNTLGYGMDYANQAALGMPGTDLAPYMNPYLDMVAGNTLGQLDRARDTAITKGQAAATAAGAYGGSRHGVADSLTNREYFDSTANAMGNLYKSGFDSATQLQQADLNRRMMAANAMGDFANIYGSYAGRATDMANAYGGLAGRATDIGSVFNQLGNSYGALGGQYLDFSTQQRQNALQNIAALQMSGNQQQSLDQAQRDAAYSAVKEAQDYQMRQLSILQGAQSATPYGTTTTQNMQNNPLGSALGGGLSGYAMASMLGATNPWLFALGGAAAGLLN